MPVHERRQHFRIDDEVYYDYKILESGNCYSETSITNDLLSQGGQRYMETVQYFQGLDYEMAQLTQIIALKDPAVAHYLNLMNAKIDFLVRNMTMGDKTRMRKVNISLGGMAFRTKEKIVEKTSLKMVIYTKPKMVPIIVNARVVYSQYLSPDSHRTAVAFEGLTYDQEQLLSQHIMHSRLQCQADS